MFHLARGWGHFLKSPGSILRVWHFLISWGSDAGPREPDEGLSSGALRAPELKTAFGMPARFARRLRRKIFLIFVSFFLCLGFQFFVIFLQIFVILGSEFSYSAFSYRVSEVYVGYRPPSTLRNHRFSVSTSYPEDFFQWIPGCRGCH